jgi:hypothetical protein
MTQSGYSGVYDKITDRDKLIEIAYTLACNGDLLVVNHTSNVPHDHRELYLHVYKMQQILTVDHTTNDYRVVLRHPSGRSLFSSRPTQNMVEVIANTYFNTIQVKLDMTEENCFQDSLVNMDAIEYNVLQQINKLLQYGLDNVEDIL